MTDEGQAGNPVVPSLEPMKVARWLLDRVVRDAGGPALVRVRGAFWKRVKGRWERMGDEELVNFVYRALEDAEYLWVDQREAEPLEQRRRMKPDSKIVGNVVAALKAVSERELRAVPVDLRTGKRGEMAVTLLDRVVWIDGEGMRGEGRGSSWFDPAVVPVTWDEVQEGKCERWMQALEEWSGGDEAWKELLRRWMGYCLVGSRKYERWMMLQGKIRGGKGTITKVLRRMLGEGGYVGTTLNSLANTHGLQGAELARLIVVNEVNQLSGHLAEDAARVVKEVVGRDPTTINPKNKEMLRNVVLGGAVMMVGNEIPNMPNRGEGLSGKMLVLPFKTSYQGREEFGLAERLCGEELGGIVRWCLEGVTALEQEEEASRKWPLPEGVEEVATAFRHHNNPMDPFLEARFAKWDDGFVSNELVMEEWLKWKKQNGDPRRIPRNQLSRVLVSESSWGLSAGRKGKDRVRGLYGIVLRADPEEE